MQQNQCPLEFNVLSYNLAIYTINVVVGDFVCLFFGWLFVCLFVVSLISICSPSRRHTLTRFLFFRFEAARRSVPGQ